MYLFLNGGKSGSLSSTRKWVHLLGELLILLLVLGPQVAVLIVVGFVILKAGGNLDHGAIAIIHSF